MEYWKAGILVFQRMESFSYFIAIPSSAIDPILQYPNTHFSIIPTFQLELNPCLENLSQKI